MVGAQMMNVPPELDPRCACMYRDVGQIPAEWIGPDAPFRTMYYGTSCAAWDMMPGTPWYNSGCNMSAGQSLCTNSWCQAEWCYVNSSCPSAIHANGSWFATGPGIEVDLWYSYAQCGSVNCWSGNQTGCPYDPGQYCGPDPCKCKYEGGEIPMHWYSGGSMPNWNGMALYGTSCSPWDRLAGSPFWNQCDASMGSDLCTNSWCLEKWCYVEANCSSGILATNPAWVTPGLMEARYYSYEACGNPDCYNGGIGCPYDDPRDNIDCGSTCGETREFYRAQDCCGTPSKRVSLPTIMNGVMMDYSSYR